MLYIFVYYNVLLSDFEVSDVFKQVYMLVTIHGNILLSNFVKFKRLFKDGNQDVFNRAFNNKNNFFG